MVYRMQLIYNEVVDILDVNYIARWTNGYTLSPDPFEIIEFNQMSKSLLPKEVKNRIYK